eukprot:CAMPEP_0184494402 /NCGR_PEP_ID=MMETSP0113_2-20130426/28624_1 /TAXON_ID=91329 /ORGANISM="Norrisiella sphaerica, Strain BC52" /LENGTH=278 /DNA_ID=CAMNT_0026880143 /DNA_START=45 /DNA_END=881 /DNA_ORIENTATION=-
MSTAKKISQRQAKGGAMSEILCPTNGYRGALEKKGIKPRNHHRDNLKALKSKQSENRMTKAMKDAADQQTVEETRERLAKFKGVGSAVAQHIASEPKKGHKFLRKNTRPQSSEASRDKDYVSRKVKMKPAVPRGQGPGSARHPQMSRNFLAENRTAAAETKTRAPKAKALTENKNFGKIPDYIIKRKIELAKKKEAKKKAAKKNDLPPGMVQVPEEERLEILRKLQAGKKQVSDELARFPLVVETLSRKKAKKELDDKMKEIESAIKVFSQKKVLMEA